MAKSNQTAAALEWLQNAYKAVAAAYPSVDFTRESPEITKAQADLDFYFAAYFYGQFEPPSVTLEQVRQAWRVYYRLHLTGQQELI